MQTKNKGLYAIHISVLLFGVAGIFGKLLDLHPILIVFGRTFFASIFLILLLWYFKLSLKLKSGKDYFFFALLGGILAFHWVAFFQSIQLSSVAIGLITFSTFPIFTSFFEPVFLKEKLKLSNIILGIITFGGVVLIIPDIEISNTTTQGVIWGIFSGFSFSILSILNRKFVQNYETLTIAFYQDFWATLILAPFLFFLDTEIQTSEIFTLIILGVVFTAIAHSLFIAGLLTVKAHSASLIASLEPVYGIIFAIFIVQEIPTIEVIIGGCIILGVAFYASYNQVNEHTKSEKKLIDR